MEHLAPFDRDQWTPSLALLHAATRNNGRTIPLLSDKGPTCILVLDCLFFCCCEVLAETWTRLIIANVSSGRSYWLVTFHPLTGWVDKVIQLSY